MLLHTKTGMTIDIVPFVVCVSSKCFCYGNPSCASCPNLGSLTVRVAFGQPCCQWKWSLGFDLKSFHHHHKNMLSNMVKASRDRTKKSVKFLNNLGPFYYQLVESFVFGHEPSYWKQGIPTLLPNYHRKYFYFL